MHVLTDLNIFGCDAGGAVYLASSFFGVVHLQRKTIEFVLNLF